MLTILHILLLNLPLLLTQLPRPQVLRSLGLNVSPFIDIFWQAGWRGHGIRGGTRERRILGTRHMLLRTWPRLMVRRWLRLDVCRCTRRRIRIRVILLVVGVLLMHGALGKGRCRLERARLGAIGTVEERRDVAALLGHGSTRINGVSHKQARLETR